MTSQKEIEDFIFTQALENAVSFGGTANPKALIGKVISKFPEVKKDMQHYSNTISNITEQVNILSFDEQKQKLEEINPNYAKEKKQKKKVEKPEGLAKLPDHEGPVRLRFAPAPSGHLHIGHAYNIIYNLEYVNVYGGDFILRIEDTNPENIDIKNYDFIIDEVKWLTQDKVSEVHIQSDRIKTYYKYLKQLVEEKNAYVCECDPDTFKSFVDNKEACPHRAIPKEKQLENYEKFFNGKYKDGDAVIRFKADLKNKNPALRDFPLARMKTEPHARLGNKYSLWPMYNLCAAIDDSLMDINYIVRGKDGEINGIRQDMIKDALGLKKSKYYHIGRVKFEDVELSKTKITEKVNQGVYESWEDPRVPSLTSYRKRGYLPQAFHNMIVAMGISKRDSKITDAEYHKNLNYHNKQLLEKSADRFFFIDSPVLVEIEDVRNLPFDSIELPKHPEDKGRGMREFAVEKNYFIEESDYVRIKEGDLIRLMHFANFVVTKRESGKLTLKFDSKEFSRDLDLKANVHFLPTEDHEQCEIVMFDNSKKIGICEQLGKIKEGNSLQFERFAFCRYDRKDENKRVLYYTHR